MTTISATTAHMDLETHCFKTKHDTPPPNTEHVVSIFNT